MKKYFLLLFIPLLSNLHAMDGGSSSEGEDLGGAGGGSFRGLEIVKRIPAATSFYKKSVKILEAKNYEDAKIKCTEINGKIIGSKALPSLQQNCFTFYCAKDLSTGLDGKYLATYGYCQDPTVVSNVSDMEDANIRCNDLKGKIYSKTITQNNDEQCSVYHCASDFAANEMSIFLAQYKECHLVSENGKNDIKNLTVTPDEKIIYLNGKKYVVSEPTSNGPEKHNKRATASDQ